MKNLEVVYYTDNTGSMIKPFVKERDNSGCEYYEMMDLFTKIDVSDILDLEKEKCKYMLNASHYVTLMSQGYSYEEILDVLKQQLDEKQNRNSRMEVIISLMREKDYLDCASHQADIIVDAVYELNNYFSIDNYFTTRNRKK